MIDEKYHIEDFDAETDVDIEVSVENSEDKPAFKSKIIFENSEEKVKDKDSEDFVSKAKKIDISLDEDIDIDEPIENDEKNTESLDSTNNPSLLNRFIEGFIIQSYKERPNTFKWTLAGIIISILIMYIGFWKAMMISAVVLVANIIGQLIDGNPRLLQALDKISIKFR